jgi:uncharacterized protein with HEPN domain
MSREFGDYLADILGAMREVEEFTRGMDFEALAADRKTANAVIRSLEVMGEAAKRIPEEVRQRHPGVPWLGMAAMRDKLIDEYSRVDLATVWTVVREELPPVRPHVETAAADLGVRL